MKENIQALWGKMYQTRERILARALSESAGVSYDLNVTQNIVPGTICQVIDGVEYNVNERAGLPENCKFTDVVNYWEGRVPKEEREAFRGFFDLEYLTACYRSGKEHLVHEYWTKDILGNRMLAQQHIVLYQDLLSKDILAITYVVNKTSFHALQKDELRNYDIIKSMAKMYTMVYHIDLDEDYFTEIACTVKDVRDQVGPNGAAQEKLNFYCDQIVVSEQKERMKEFFNLSTLRERLEGAPFLVTEYERKLLDGSTNWIKVIYMVCARNEEKRISQVVLAAENIDEQKKREFADRAKLQEAYLAATHANQAKTTFLNNMSHDIRTPMNAILGFTALASTHIDQPDLIKDYLGKIMASSNHLLSLINDVLDMSRIESGKIKIEERECDLSAVIHDLRNMLQADIRDRRLDLFIDTLDVEDERVVCDKLRLNQVLLNVLGNAIKFTNPGGAVALRVIQKEDSPEGYADFDFIVRDNGIGMNEEFIKHIFEPFVREESTTVNGIPGTGLGLAITKNLVDMMNGTIAVKSRLGEGTEFRISFRFVKVNHPAQKKGIKSLKGFRALVADDSTDACVSTSRMLKVIGMRPDWTTSGKEAVIRAELAAEEQDEYKVYIIDWLMPDMNGVEVVRRIRRVVGEEAPIIILTAYDWSDIEEEAREAGVTAFCAKPLFLSELYSVLQDASEESEQMEEAEQIVDAEEFKGKRILLVDDIELNREIARAILDEAGIQVVSVNNGAEAVKVIGGAEPGYFDLILMDVMMPVMDGYEATRRIRQLENPQIANIPIIAMTANAFEEDRLHALEAGMNEHLAKPFQIEALYDIMRKFIQ